MPTRETARVARNKGLGRKRARIWRALGFANLVLARAARWKGHKRKAKLEQLEQLDSPFTLDKRPRGF